MINQLGLRWLYVMFLLGFLGLDSISLIILRSRAMCIRNDRCQVPDGFTSKGINILIYRDLFAVGLQVWALFVLGYIILTAPVSVPDLKPPKESLHDASRARRELLRCGFFSAYDHEARYRPVFGIRRPNYHGILSGESKATV